METIEIHEAEMHLSQLVDRAAAGEVIVIAKGGRPLARLVPISRRTERRPLGLLKGFVRVSDDFDAPLPDGVMNVPDADRAEVNPT